MPLDLSIRSDRLVLRARLAEILENLRALRRAGALPGHPNWATLREGLDPHIAAFAKALSEIPE